MDIIKAECRCGKVKLSFSLPVTKVVQCHCESCRKMNGSDYSSWIVINNDQIRIVDGNDHIKKFKLNNLSSKSFCSTCGTGVFGINGKHFKNHKLVPLGIVNNYTKEIKPQVQVYTENKAKWVELHKGIPVFPVK